MLSLLDLYGFDFNKWDSNRPTAGNSVVSMYLDIFKAAIEKDTENEAVYKDLFFGELFLYYAEKSKGDVALEILANDDLASKIVVPAYIREGLEWLSK